jgi:hypothetical protein
MRAVYLVAQRVADRRWFRAWLTLCAVDVFAVRACDLRRSERLPRVFVVRRAREEDLPALASFSSRAVPPMTDRLRRGDECVMTLADGRICAAVWLAVGPADYPEDWDQLGCIFRVPAGICLTYDGRGTRWGAWGALMACLPPHLERLGVRTVFTLIDCDNRNSLESHRSLGYHPVGRIALMAVLGWALSVCRIGQVAWRVVPGRLGRVALSDDVIGPSPSDTLSARPQGPDRGNHISGCEVNVGVGGESADAESDRAACVLVGTTGGDKNVAGTTRSG